MEAVVILEVIDAPLSKLPGVIELVLKASGIPGAGVHAAAGIDAQLQAAGVDIVRVSFDSVRKLLKSCQGTEGVL